jgi:hypothetical protein
VGRWINTSPDGAIGYEPPMDIGRWLNVLLQMELLRSVRELRAPKQTQPDFVPIEDNYEYAGDDEEPDGEIWGW